MTTIEHKEALAPTKVGGHFGRVAGLVIFILSGCVMGAQAWLNADQSRVIEDQHKIITDMASTFTETGVKFAFGFLAGCGRPCVIRDNPGGVIRDYEWLSSLVNVREQIVIIDGSCASACALFADHARSNIRITDRAVFKFHQVSDGTEPWHSSDIADWVHAHGGFPPQDSGRLTEMTFDDARRFWQPFFDNRRLPFDLNGSRHRHSLLWSVDSDLDELRGTLR